MNVRDVLVKTLGWRATVLHGDPCVYGRWKWLKRYLASGPLRTLDVGSGSGAFTMYAARIGNDAVGVSFDGENNRKAKARANMLGLQQVSFITADVRGLDKYGSKLGTFDQILCLETIEHIADDRKFMADLAALLKPGGTLLLTTPYKHYKPLLYDELSAGDDGGHVRWGYTHEELRDMMVSSGLQVTTEEYVCGFIAQQLTNLMRWIARVNLAAAWAATAPLRVLQMLDGPVTRALKYPCLSVAVIGRKAS